jgi:hypothetical protein
VLAAARPLVARPDNDFMYSSWLHAEHALRELDELAAALDGDLPLPAGQLGVVFAPTGPMHELAVSSGWSREFGTLASEVDDALAAAATRVELACSLCEKVAGTVWLESDAQVARASFTSRLWLAVAPRDRRRLRAALCDRDVAALFALEEELAPFWCPACAASYCGAHWTRWSVFDDDGWHDSIRGRCPQGHERMLED